MKKWMSEPPQECDACGGKIGKVFVDGVVHGRWGIMCPMCHRSRGGRLGVGVGQRYVLNERTNEYEQK